MHFSDMGNGKHGNTGKFVLVAGLHVAVGVLFVHSLSTRHLSLPFMPDPVTVVLQADPPAPPTPVDPPSPTQQLAPPPTLFVPPPEIPVAAPPEPAPTVTATSAEAQPPQPAQPAQPAADPGPPATATPHGASPGQMRSAVFADANGCALPSYPAKAAREGESGTTMLALLVGADGRVSSARVQHSSGSRDLDRAALQALSLCKFKPATTNGVPEAGWAQLAYVWTLD